VAGCATTVAANNIATDATDASNVFFTANLPSVRMLAYIQNGHSQWA
jgi:hypothetical protein